MAPNELTAEVRFPLHVLALRYVPLPKAAKLWLLSTGLFDVEIDGRRERLHP